MVQPEGYGTRKDLVLYRIETAKENLHAAQIHLEAGEYKSANNRAYYAIFHSVNAVHALAGNAYKRHKVIRCHWGLEEQSYDNSGTNKKNNLLPQESYDRVESFVEQLIAADNQKVLLGEPEFFKSDKISG